MDHRPVPPDNGAPVRSRTLIRPSGRKAPRLPNSGVFGEQAIGATRDWEGQVDDRNDNQAWFLLAFYNPGPPTKPTFIIRAIAGISPCSVIREGFGKIRGGPT